MPISSSLVGRTTQPQTQHVDARWIMSYGLAHVYAMVDRPPTITIELQAQGNNTLLFEVFTDQQTRAFSDGCLVYEAGIPA